MTEKYHFLGHMLSNDDVPLTHYTVLHSIIIIITAEPAAESVLETIVATRNVGEGENTRNPFGQTNERTST